MHDTTSATAEESSIERRRPEPPHVERSDAQPVDVAPAEPVEVGGTVLDETRRLVAARRFVDAARVLDSLHRLRPDDPEVIALEAVTHAHIGRHRNRVKTLLHRLSADFPDRSITWRTVSLVSMARFQFGPAQKAARTAVHLGPNSVANWHTLAAAYAGNGWFDEAAVCLEEATKLDPIGSDADGRDEPIGFGPWQIGRAVNYWALTRSYLAALAIVGTMLFGLLGLAVALSSPMLIREVRIRAAPEPFRTLADLVWRSEHRLRLLVTASVSAVLLVWVVLIIATR